jgi:hypothetical protein
MQMNTLPFAPRRTWSRQPRRSWKYQSKRLYQINDKCFAMRAKRKKEFVALQSMPETRNWLLDMLDDQYDPDEINDYREILVSSLLSKWKPDCFCSNLSRSESWGMEMWNGGWVCGACNSCTNPEPGLYDDYEDLKAEEVDDNPLEHLELKYNISQEMIAEELYNSVYGREYLSAPLWYWEDLTVFIEGFKKKFG